MPEIAWVDTKQVSKVAEYLRANPPETKALNFYSFPNPDGGEPFRADAMYPDLHHPRALDFFFYVVLQDYGFWYGSEEGYLEPLMGHVEGDSKRRKGSDFLWRLMKKELDHNPNFFAPEELANIRPEVLSCALADSIGTQWPDFDNRLQLTRAWGRWLLDFGTTPQHIVDTANKDQVPLYRFLDTFRTSPYGRDPLMKKAILLALVLYNRPESFLRVSEKDEWPAIVDYHLMRVAERLGMVKISPGLVTHLIYTRSWVSPQIECAIREETRKAVEQLTTESGLTHGDIDNILWQARGFCPEMSKPDCANCLFVSVCEQRIELFQPVIRTDAY